MIRKATLYAWAGFMYVWTLLSVVALFYFPVYLDASATRLLPRGPMPWGAVALAAAGGPLCLAMVLDSTRVRAGALYAPFRATVVNLWLWLTFTTWQPTGRVVWDAGFAWARPLYMLYWIAAAVAAYALSLAGGGLGDVSGCGPILGYLRNAPGSPRKFDAPSLYRYSRHPFCTYLIVSLWLTPLMTADRLLWAALGSIHAVGIAGAEERRMERVFGGEYRAYRSRVLKWLPIRYKGEEGDPDAA